MHKSYHHLTKNQRCQLALLKRKGESVQSISCELKVHRSTIYREIKRNQSLGNYDDEKADELAQARRSQASIHKTKMTPEVTEWVKEHLKGGWSPEQIAGRMKFEKRSDLVSHETIYNHIRRDRCEGGTLYRHLPHHGKKYNKRGKGKIAGRGCIPGRVGIEERPSVVEKKDRLGDWELDTIIGSGRSGVIVSMVDRASKKVRLAKVGSCTAQEVTQALVGCLRDEVVLTMTADNGKEFAAHQDVAKLLGASFYFADPYHSWQRGLNEHCNGLVRRYFKKKQRFDEITEEEVLAVERALNHRPRKILNFRTPIEAAELLAEGGPSP